MKSDDANKNFWPKISSVLKKSSFDTNPFTTILNKNSYVGSTGIIPHKTFNLKTIIYNLITSLTGYIPHSIKSIIFRITKLGKKIFTYIQKSNVWHFIKIIIKIMLLPEITIFKTATVIPQKVNLISIIYYPAYLYIYCFFIYMRLHFIFTDNLYIYLCL